MALRCIYPWLCHREGIMIFTLACNSRLSSNLLCHYPCYFKLCCFTRSSSIVCFRRANYFWPPSYTIITPGFSDSLHITSFTLYLICLLLFVLCLLQVSYRTRQIMNHQAIMKMIAVWVLAFVLYGPAILFWDLVVGRSRVPKDECFAEFYYSWSFLLSASTLEFFSPFISVAIFNLSIYLSIRRRRLRSREAQLHLQLSKPASAHGGAVPASHNWGLGMKLAARGSIHSQSSSPCLGKLDPSTSRAAQPSRLSRDKKIAKSLAIIVCVFAICWAPYTLLMIIRAACRGRCIQHHWYEVTFWLLWLNSAINPFLYPLCHSSFRRAFGKILCPRQHTPPPTSVLRAAQ